jgi:hypothetical protein
VRPVEWLPGNVPVPNFQWICRSLAYESMSSPTRGVDSRVATNIQKTLRCFHDQFAEQRFETHLLELAVIDNRSLREGTERAPDHGDESPHTSTADDVSDQPRFVSLVTTYGTNAEHAKRLLEAWDGAIKSVVMKDERSMVGQTETYQALYFAFEAPVGLAEAVGDSGPACASYAKWYPFGLRTAYSQSPASDASAADGGVAERMLREVVKPIAAGLLSSFADQIGQPKGLDPSKPPLALVVVPFRRPFPWTIERDDPWALGGDVLRAGDDDDLMSWKERCGGCLFAIVSGAKGEQLDERLRQAVVEIQWILARAAMFEARLERALTSSSDIGAFTHATRGYLRSIRAPIGRLLQVLSNPAPDRSLIERNVAELSSVAQTMENVAEAHRLTWQIVNVEGAAGRELDRLSLGELSHRVAGKVKSLFDKVVAGERLNEGPAPQAEYDREQLTALDQTVFAMRDRTLDVILAELVGNAVRHADYCGAKTKIRIALEPRKLPRTERLAVFFTVTNPIPAESVAHIENRIDKGTFSLGLQTIANLGLAHGFTFRFKVLRGERGGGARFEAAVQITQPLAGPAA